MRLTRMRKIVGTPKGLYLAFFKKIKKNPIPISVKIFGEIKTYYEILGLDNNFAVGLLRDAKVEKYLNKKKNPCIIDCGVNVGLTVRWWFHLNNCAKVFGIDMIKETHDFTISVLENNLKFNQNDKAYDFNPITCALFNKDSVEFKIDVSDPLLGDNNIFDNNKTPITRIVKSKTLDTVCRENEIDEVDLLKVDIEGAGAHALEGAINLLKRTKYIVFEVHNEDECKLASKILFENGFCLRKISTPHLWWEKV